MADWKKVWSFMRIFWGSVLLLLGVGVFIAGVGYGSALGSAMYAILGVLPGLIIVTIALYLLVTGIQKFRGKPRPKIRNNK